MYATFYVAKMIYAFFLSQKTIYALRPESFCALKVAILKVQTFWASGSLIHHFTQTMRSIQTFKLISPVLALGIKLGFGTNDLSQYVLPHCLLTEKKMRSSFLGFENNMITLYWAIMIRMTKKIISQDWTLH